MADPGDTRTFASFAATHALPVGTRLRDYEVTDVVGAGRTAIVYRAFDHSLQRQVAVQEFAPSALAGRGAGTTAVAVTASRHRAAFKAGLKAFVDEARLLARFDHPALIKVYRFWEDNGTAYTAMPFYEGPSLRAALGELGHVPSEGEIRAWLRPLLDAVGVLHAARVWHLNVSPDTIVQTALGPVLLGRDGAARAIAASESMPKAPLRAGFAAIEQYGGKPGGHAGASVGPWSDVHALGAVVRSAITGEDPPPAPARVFDDRLRPLAVVAAGLYSAPFLAAIDAALAVSAEQRPRGLDTLRAMLGDMAAAAPLTLAEPTDPMAEPFLGTAADDDPITVPDPSTMPPAAAEPASRGASASRPAPLVRPGGAPSPATPGAEPSAEPSWLAPRTPRRGRRVLRATLVAGAILIVVLLAWAWYGSARATEMPLSDLSGGNRADVQDRARRASSVSRHCSRMP